MRSHSEVLNVLLPIVVILGSQLATARAHSHELAENRAALVLRNDRLVSVTLYVNLGETLHKALMPAGDRFEHTARLASMSDVDFAKQFNAAKTAIQSGIVFKSVIDKPLKVSAWQWPEAAAAHKHLRELIMRMVVSPGAHFHETPVEVRAQVQSDERLTSVRVEMPEALRPMTLIATRPRQSRLNASTSSLMVDF